MSGYISGGDKCSTNHIQRSEEFLGVRANAVSYMCDWEPGREASWTLPDSQASL